MTMQLLPASGSGINGEVVARVRSLKGLFGLNQTVLAEVLDVAQTQMSKRLLGKVPFSLSEVEILADYFGTTAGYLMGFTEGPAPRDPRSNDQGSDVRTRRTGQCVALRPALVSLAAAA